MGVVIRRWVWLMGGGVRRVYIIIASVSPHIQGF